MTPSPKLPPVVLRFIEDAGSLTQSLGIGRVLGQIYAYLYFSAEPRGLSDMQDVLAISKGSASMGVRQLEQWNAVRKVWVRGDRKDYYEANDWIGQIVRNLLRDTIGKNLGSTAALLDELKNDLNGLEGADGEGEAEFIEQRIEHLHRFHEKVQKAWGSPLVKLLLK